MKPATLILALTMLAGAPAAAMAGDWYVHRSNHQMKVPPWYCYCYSMSKANVLAGKVTYPMDMQITLDQAKSKLAAYAALPDTCPGNCAGGAGASGGNGGNAGGPPSTPPRPAGPTPAPECQKFAQVGGCTGFCRGMAAGYEETLGAEIKKCISDCLDKFHCEQ